MRPRLLVITDIGGDPDDQQSLTRLLVYANEFRIEGLVASSAGIPGECSDPTPRTDLLYHHLNAYECVHPFLLRHAEGWPSAEALRAVVKAGQGLRGLGAIGEGQDTEASRWIVERVDAATPDDPLNVSIWGGQTDFAQALWRVRQARGLAGLAAFASRLRVYDIADQDAVAIWMRAEFPGLRYILSKAPEGADGRLATFRGMYLGGDESLTSREWVEQHIRSRGPLGELYPVEAWTAPNPHRCLKEGDTPSWFFFLPRGGNLPADPTRPGWGGRFVREADGWYRDIPYTAESDPRATISAHRADFQADFARRMAWCVE